MRYFITADLVMGIDFPDNLIHPQLLPFEIPEKEPDIIVNLASQEKFDSIEYKDEKVFEYKPGGYVAHIMENGAYVALDYVTMNKKGWNAFTIDTRKKPAVVTAYGTSPRNEILSCNLLYLFIRGGVFTAMQSMGYYMLHSASVIEDGKVYAFTALAGTGKSTQANKWEELFNLPHFNGDLLCIKCGENPPRAYGTPWCGSSGKQYVGSLPFGGLFFLYRDEYNHIEEVRDETDKLLLLSQRMWALNFTDRAFMKIISDLKETSVNLKCAKLYCLPDDSSAIMAHEYAQKYMK